MSEIIMIACIAKNYAIGMKGQIPWHISADFQHFKEKTLGYPCIMGDITFESLPDNARPLPGRENIILTLDKDYKAPEGVKVFHDYEEALEYAKAKYDKVFITGGATIYRLGMKYADKLEITRIEKEYEGDTFFPEIKEEEWEETAREDHFDEKEQAKFSFVTYARKKSTSE